MLLNFLFAVFSFSFDRRSIIDADKVFAHYDSIDCDVLKNEKYLSHFDFIEPLNNCVDIRDSIFLGISIAHGHGGAIFFGNNAFNSSLSIVQCTFTQCTSDEGHGGAIESQAIKTIILYSCGSECTSYISGQFIYLAKNDASESTINVTTVVYSDSEGDSPVDNYVTKALMNQINISSCNLKDNKGTGSFKISTASVYMRECTIFNVTSKCYILSLNSYDCNNDIKRLNIIKNTASNGIIFFNGHWSLAEVIFSENTGKYAASVSTAKLLLTSCTFDVEFDLPDKVVVDECKFGLKTSTYAFGHLNTQLCGAVISATPYSPDMDDDDDGKGGDTVWKDKGVIGALTGGIVGAFVLGIVIGAVVCFIKKKKSNEFLGVTSNPLISANDK